nr:MAG TPA: hypothetical protein [Caudoviricetes sp.]
MRDRISRSAARRTAMWVAVSSVEGTRSVVAI